MVDGRVIAARSWQLEKVLLPIEVTPSGMLIEVMRALAKAAPSIIWTESGIVIVARAWL
jgi:hypothetical protein